MASANPFDLLGDDDNDDPSHLIAVQQQKIAAKKLTPPSAAAAPSAPVRLPSKPVPPSQAVREARSEAGQARGGGAGNRGAPGRGRGSRGGPAGANRDYGNARANGLSGGYAGGGGGGVGGGGGEDGDAGKYSERERSYGAPRQPFRGARRGGYGNGEAGGDPEQPPRRVFERRSGTGRGNETKRDGAGRGNWGTPTDDVLTQEIEEVVKDDTKVVSPVKEQEDTPVSDSNKEGKEGATNETEEKEEEEKEMTLEEYEKIREEKRKALLAMKSKERKVAFDKEFESMQQLSIKKGNDDIFIKLGSDKDSGKRKENVKKSVSINEFLKPTEGEGYFSPGGRGRGRGRGGDRGGPFRGGFGTGGGTNTTSAAAPSIEDPGQFPSLGGK